MKPCEQLVFIYLSIGDSPDFWTMKLLQIHEPSKKINKNIVAFEWQGPP